MTSGVIFYGNLAKAGIVLAAVQASIEGIAKDATRGHPASREVLLRYVAELEEIERDLVALINAGRQDAGGPDSGDGAGSRFQADTPLL